MTKNSKRKTDRSSEFDFQILNYKILNQIPNQIILKLVSKINLFVYLTFNESSHW